MQRIRVTWLLAFVVLAVAGFVLSVALDHQADWGNPQQAVANISRIIFLLSAVGTVLTAIVLLARRFRGSAR